MAAAHDGVDNAADESMTVIQLRWQGATEAPTIYVDQLLAAHTRDTCFLIFGEIDPLEHPADPEQIPEYVPVTPRVKLAIPISRMPDFVRLIQDNLDMLMQDDNSDSDTERTEESQ